MRPLFALPLLAFPSFSKAFLGVGFFFSRALLLSSWPLLGLGNFLAILRVSSLFWYPCVLFFFSHLSPLPRPSPHTTGGSAVEAPPTTAAGEGTHIDSTATESAPAVTETAFSLDSTDQAATNHGVENAPVSDNVPDGMFCFNYCLLCFARPRPFSPLRLFSGIFIRLFGWGIPYDCRSLFRRLYISAGFVFLVRFRSSSACSGKLLAIASETFPERRLSFLVAFRFLLASALRGQLLGNSVRCLAGVVFVRAPDVSHLAHTPPSLPLHCYRCPCHGRDPALPHPQPHLQHRLLHHPGSHPHPRKGRGRSAEAHSG